MQTRRCSRCRVEKGVDEFYKDRNRASGLTPYCKVCHNKQGRETRAKNAARDQLPVISSKRCPKCCIEKPPSEFYLDKGTKDGLKAWCKSCHCAGTLASARRNPERVRESARRRRKRNPDRVRAVERKYWDTHKDECLARQQKWREANPETVREGQRRYLLENPEKARVKTRNREARKRAAPGSFSNTDIEQQHTVQGGLCFWCSEELLEGRWAIDHVIALNRGGSNWPANLVCSCIRCNSSKSDKLPWLEWRPRNPLQSWHPALDDYLNQDKQNE